MLNENKNLAVVIPCYRSADQIEKTCNEILQVLEKSKELEAFKVIFSRIILIDDGSDYETKKTLQKVSQHSKIDLISLNKNYGQHPAIFAGVLNSYEDFIVTMDEDGEHNPEDIIRMIEKVIKTDVDIIYAKFIFSKLNWKELSSNFSKFVISKISGDKNVINFTSFRLVKGSIFRTAAVYANNGSFLDVALGWITKKVDVIQTQKRTSTRPSTYNLRSLFGHFGKLFFATGVRPLIFLFNLGWITSLVSFFAIIFILYRRVFDYVPVQGWVSNTVVLMFFGGLIISALGLIARYISSIVETSSGKPFFTINNNSND